MRQSSIWIAGLEPPPRSSRRIRGLAPVSGLVIGSVLGYLGWILPTPGGSLVVPTLIVFGTGTLVGIVGWSLASFGPQRPEFRTFGISTLLFTFAASLWTFQFSLPTSMALDSGAMQQVQSAFDRLNSNGPTGPNHLPFPSCSEILNGSIGPLQAPYRVCAYATTVGRFVLFKASDRGIGYTNAGSATFEDQCERHLTGPWWMFVDDRSGIGECPIGYHFQGGG